MHMPKFSGFIAIASLALVAGCSSADSSPGQAPPLDQGTIAPASAGGNGRHAQVCPGFAAPGEARCHAYVRVDADGNPAPAATPSGFGPSDLRSAYNISGSGSSSTTIAIVDAYGYSRAESDLAVYRSQFGLPPCTTANGCFRKVDQNGGTHYPRENTGWAQETALDLDMASAICPNCKLLLVEAASNSFGNLAAAVDMAVAMGATIVSNSYGGGENGS